MAGFFSRMTGGPSHGEDESIVRNVQTIFNSQRGGYTCDASFGRIDFTDMLHSWPTGARRLERELRETILRFEPRLSDVEVRLLPSDVPMNLLFSVVAKNERRPIRMVTKLDERGRFHTALAPRTP